MVYLMLRRLLTLVFLVLASLLQVGCVSFGSSSEAFEGKVAASMTASDPPVQYYEAGNVGGAGDIGNGAGNGARDGDGAGGQRVIFVHGTPGDASNFDRYLITPVAGFDCVAVDRPGWGGSSPERAEPSLKAQAAALAPLLAPALDENGIERWPILVGHSLGGPIIARMAIDFPDKVGGLLILAGSLDPELEEIMFIQRVGAIGLTPFLLPRWLRHTNQELLPLEEELKTLSERLCEVTCPVLIVHGTDDDLVPFENVEYMKEAFTSAGVTVIELQDAGHMLPWTHETQLRQWIKDLAAIIKQQ